jgi:hypothetical protein
MILMMSCPTIKDKVQFLLTGQFASLPPDLNKARDLVRQLSLTEFLIQQARQGQTIMLNKVYFDKYLQAQVDLMRACIEESRPCPFASLSCMDSAKTISTAGLATKEQWAVEMVLSRYIVNSVYQIGAFSDLDAIYK